LSRGGRRLIFIVATAGCGLGETRRYQVAFRSTGPRRAGPVDRFLNQGNSSIDTPFHLRRELLETFGSKRASRSLRSRRQYRRHSQMESRVKRYRLIHDPEIPIELFELAAHGRELAGQCRGIARIFVGAEHTIEGYFDKRRFGSARTAGRFRQSRGHTFGEINTNSGFHGKIPLKRN
jgi:hypothetical protein